ncbi:MAG TPA: DUF853 family protein [Anaerolineae bacterium]|nr:DUF853 family protein [Anaerolineae bacterium]
MTKIFELSLPDLFRVGQAEQTRMLQQLVSLFAGAILGDCRFITIVAPLSFDKLIRKRRKLATSRESAWERRGLLEEADLIEKLGKSGMQRAKHYLIDFAGKLSVGQLAQWRIVAKEVTKVSLLPQGKYREFTTYMQPITASGAVDHSRPLYSIMQSAYLKGAWTVESPLISTLAASEWPLVLVIDVRKIKPSKLEEAATQWGSLAQNSEQPERMAAQAEAESEFALRQRDQRVHHVRLLWMTLATKAEDLIERTEELAAGIGQSMGVDRLAGYQALAAAYFTPLQKPPLTPKGHFNVMSAGVALCAAVWGIGREQRTDGFFLGKSIDAIAPHIVYLPWQGNDPFHGLILGRTGTGKTVALQAFAARLAEQGIQVILLEPQGHSQRLLALGGEMAAYHKIAYGEVQYNPLELFFPEKSEQYDHVTTVFQLLLKRGFNNFERAAIRQGLEIIYRTFSAGELLEFPERTPILAYYCQRLSQKAAELDESTMERPNAPLIEAMRTISAELQALFVDSDFGRTFNAQTNIDLRLQARMNLFDFSAVPQELRGLFYYLTVSNLIRRIRSEGFKQRVLFIDEVYYMSREPMLMQALAEMLKTVRSYGTAVVLADQDLETYLGVEGAGANTMNDGLDITSGVYIINNTQWVLSFGLKRSAAERLAQQYPGAFLPTHVEFLDEMGSRTDAGAKGMGVIIYQNRVEMIYMQLRPREATQLLGS